MIVTLKKWEVSEQNPILFRVGFFAEVAFRLAFMEKQKNPSNISQCVWVFFVFFQIEETLKRSLLLKSHFPSSLELNVAYPVIIYER